MTLSDMCAAKMCIPCRKMSGVRKDWVKMGVVTEIDFACPNGYQIIPDGTQTIPSAGPGTEMKAILADYGIKPHACRCNPMAAQMDAWGPDGCEEHAAEIIAHLEREAAAHAWLRFVPFKAVGARGLLALAIERSRRKLACRRGKTPSGRCGHGSSPI